MRALCKRVAATACMLLLARCALAAETPAGEEDKFPPLVPEGEPESLLGVTWKAGKPSFSNAPHKLGAQNAVACSPDGRTLASAGNHGTVRVWDGTSGRLLRMLEGHAGEVWSVAYSPDGKSLASASHDLTVRVWDATSGRLLRKLEGHTDLVFSVVYSPDGKSLASASRDRTVRVWDATSGRLLRKLEGHAGTVLSVAFSPDGKALASASYDWTVRVWDASTGRLLRKLEGHAGLVKSVAYSPDGKNLASASADNAVRVWDAASGRPLRTLEGHAGLVFSVAYSPDGKNLASASKDKTVRVWDATNGRLLRTLEGHAGEVRSVAYIPDSQSLASASDDNTVRVWDTTSGQLLRRVQGLASWVSSVAYSPDGKNLASASADNAVRVWDATSGRLLHTLEGHARGVNSVAYSPDGKNLASASDDNTVRVWDSTGGRLLRTLEGHAGLVRSVAYSPDGKSLASASNDNTVRVWDATSGRLLHTLEGHTGGVNSVAYSPDCKSLASANADNTVRVWGATSGRLLRIHKGHTFPVKSVAYSPDGKSLASASDDNTVRVWDATSGRLLRTLRGHAHPVNSVAYSPDGKSLASASDETTVRVWDATSGRLLRTLRGHAHPVNSVAYSPDGKSLASASNDSTVRIWNLRRDVIKVMWSGGDGWVAWRADVPPEHRVLRGENGNLLTHRNDDGSITSIPPPLGQNPQLTAQAETRQSAKQGEMGVVAVTVRNDIKATPALWVEVLDLVAPKVSDILIRPSPTIMRLDPGASVTIPVEFIRKRQDNPGPGRAGVVLALHHAFDRGVPIEVPVDLVFQSPWVKATVRPPAREGDGLTVPVVLSNAGDQTTGRSLAVNALFRLPNGQSIPSESKTVYEEGLRPDESKEFSLKVPKEVVKAKSFALRLMVSEGFGPGVPAGSPAIGYASMWTIDRPGLTPPGYWQLTLLLGLGIVLAGVGTHFFRIYRNPFVVAASEDPATLIQNPLRLLPKASRALERAQRLDATLGKLGISSKRWSQALAAASDARKAVENLLLVLGAQPGEAIPGTVAIRMKLPSLHVRFGPEAAVALLEGRGNEPGEAQRLNQTVRDAGIAALVLLDLTESENGHQVFGEVARFAGVVLGADNLRDVLLADQPLTALEQVIAGQRPLREIPPFRTAGGVEEAALFFGRAAELRKLADRELQNAVLVGARQMGKSSLLKAVARRLGTRKSIEVRYLVLGSDDLMGEIAAEMDQKRPQSIAQFQNLVQGSKDRPRVWLIDEADKFVQADLASAKRGEISWALRALAEEGTTYFVLAGYWQLFRAAVFAAESPIRNLGEMIRLGPLDPEAAAELVREPMGALRISVKDDAVASILEETGCRANLLVLACQGLLERIGPEQKTLTIQDLEKVWNDHSALREALMYWKEAPLDRAVGHAALALDRPTRHDIEARLAALGIRASATDLDQAFERLELGYVLLRQADPDGGIDRWTCPVPLIPRFEKRIMSWDDHLQRDAENLRHSDGNVKPGV